MQQKWFLLPLIVLLFIRCSGDKDEELPTPIPPSVISLKLEPATYERIKTGEIIISEQSGKKLLDTVVSTFQQHSLTIRSLETNFIVTTIVVDPTTNKAIVDSYVQVNPNNWVMKPGGRFAMYAPAATTPFEEAKVTYINVPYIPDENFYFTNSFGSGSMFSSYRRYANELEVNYEKHPSNYTYLVIPSRNLYKIVETQAGNATIDLAQMEPATRVNFKVPAHLKLSWVNLFGFPIANDYANKLWLYFSHNFRLEGEYDLIYPKNHIAKFELSTDWFDAAGNFYEYNSLADSIPTHLPFIDDSHVRVTSQTVENLQVDFLKSLPTYYASTWVINRDEVVWRVYFPPSKTSFNTKEFVSSLGSTLLKGKNLSDLKLTKLVFEKVDDLSHQTFFDNQFMEPAANKENKMKVFNKFTKKMD